MSQCLQSDWLRRSNLPAGRRAIRFDVQSAIRKRRKPGVGCRLLQPIDWYLPTAPHSPSVAESRSQTAVGKVLVSWSLVLRLQPTMADYEIKPGCGECLIPALPELTRQKNRWRHAVCAITHGLARISGWKTRIEGQSDMSQRRTHIDPRISGAYLEIPGARNRRAQAPPAT